VYDVASSGLYTIDPELAAAQRRVADHFAKLGARVMPFSHPDLKHAFQIWSALMTAAAEVSFGSSMGDGIEIALLPALFALLRGDSPHTFPGLALVAAERVTKWVPGVERTMQAAQRLKRDLDVLLDDRAMLLYPSYPDQAPRHDEPLWSPFKWQYTAIWNVMELPVTQVPLGLSGRGLPLGVQVVAGYARDHLGIAAALELERAFGGWVPPSA
jgi:fatty acid amide hydrolase 2